jgi:hypothetical protein
LFRAFHSAEATSQLATALGGLAPDVRAEVERRLARRRAIVFGLPDARPQDSPADILGRARRNHEAAIIALLGIFEAREAARFASTVRLFYEWEGFAEPPLDEARSAEDYIRRTPTTSISRYVELFLLYRYRAAFEAAEWEASHPPGDQEGAEARARWTARQRDLQRIAADGYARVWATLNTEVDVVVRAVAADLDGRASLYMSASHPRDFIVR